MAIAYVQEFDAGSDRTTTNYDWVAERLGVESDPPKGCIVHTAGFDGDTFRIFEVWESEAAWERFRDERLTPLVQELMGSGAAGGPPARESTYELHDVFRP